jgi:tRNA(fMet)-specific endonuclease VapC
MKYLLDTDICIYWLKGNKSIEQMAISLGLHNISISFMTLSELYYGAYKSKFINNNLTAIKLLIEKLSVVGSDETICAYFGNIKALLEKNGMIIDDADIFIAACALTNDAILVTNNEKHYNRIDGLQLQNWYRHSTIF